MNTKKVADVDGRVLELTVLEAQQVSDLPAPVCRLLEQAKELLEQYRAYEAVLAEEARRAQEAKEQARQAQLQEVEAFHEQVEQVVLDVATAEQLVDAVGDADEKKVLQLLKKDRAHPDLEDHEGNTALSEAACYGEADLVELLHKHGASLDSQNAQGRTPLFRACFNGHLDVVETLLRLGADAGLADSNGDKPAKIGTAETKQAVEAAPDKDACGDPLPRKVVRACERNDAESVDTLLDERANLTHEVVSIQLGGGAMYVASIHGSIDVVRVLLGANAEVDACSREGTTCLCAAARKGDLALARLLLKRKRGPTCRARDDCLSST